MTTPTAASAPAPRTIKVRPTFVRLARPAVLGIGSATAGSSAAIKG